jgi:hypothetical protein
MVEPTDGRVRLSAMLIGGVIAIAATPGPAAGQTAGEGDADLAEKLSNPVAALISVPLQLNYDQGFGADDGEVWRLNVQPVVPIGISEDWNLISRTIVPLTYQNDVAPGAGSQFGLGDTLQSAFISPVEPTSGGWIWGAGPVVLLPTATDDLLGGEKWAAGPTAVVLRQGGGWTYGALANHLWSFAGDADRSDVNTTFAQPFLSYTTADAWTFGLNTETTYNWDESEWTVPVNASASKLIRIGDQAVRIGGGVRYWAASPEAGPDGVGFRLTFTLLFPK